MWALPGPNQNDRTGNANSRSRMVNYILIKYTPTTTLPPHTRSASTHTHTHTHRTSHRPTDIWQGYGYEAIAQCLRAVRAVVYGRNLVAHCVRKSARAHAHRLIHMCGACVFFCCSHLGGIRIVFARCPGPGWRARDDDTRARARRATPSFTFNDSMIAIVL